MPTIEPESTDTSAVSTPVNVAPIFNKTKVSRYILDKDYKASNDRINIEDSVVRFKYLLGLTDLFRHFINFREKQDPKLKIIMEKVEESMNQKPSSKRKSRRKSGRGRKSEREEDAELLHEEEEEEEEYPTVFTESPTFVHGKLREYQIQGLNWLISLHEHSISGILADEMGLGKTLQTISFLGYLRYVLGIEGPHIIVVPKSTLDNWDREFKKWTPDVNVLLLRGDKDERANLVANRLLACDFDICITSFELVIREKSQLKKIAWQYIIVDEAHRIKNEESMLSQIIRLFHSRNRLLVTGTPLQNNLHELWALLNFLLPDVFADSSVFDEWFEEQGTDQDTVVQQLHKVLQPFLLRRVKADVEKSLLPKKEVNLYVGMSEMQVKWYQKLLEKDIDAVNGAAGKREGKTRLLNIVMQLRKCCNHPYLFEGAEPGPPYTTDEHLVYNAGKMIILDKLLKRMKDQGSRVLIFSQMSRMLDILEDYCIFRDYQYCRIDGSTDHEDRVEAIDDYNSEGSDKFIFLLTTRAGGLGINLTSADIVVLYDSDWNPQADLQAMDRAHRIGQKKQVMVFRFVTENAIEEKVLERAAQKLRLDQLVIQQGRGTTQDKNKTAATNKDDLLKMIQHGAAAVFEDKNRNGTFVDDDIDNILKKGEQRTAQLNSKYSKLGLDDLQNFTSDSSLYEWNGEDFAKRAKEHSMLAWINPSKRERREQTYSIDTYYKDLMVAKAGLDKRNGRVPRKISLLDFQFFPPILKELQEKEMYYLRRKANSKVTVSEIADEDLEEGESKEQRRYRENKKIDKAEPLTEEEEAIKNEALTLGFTNWSKRDFTHFVQSSAKHGQNNYKAISEDLHSEDKTPEEVERYAKVFWERGPAELEGFDKYASQIQQGESRRKKLELQKRLLKQKIESYVAPMSELQLSYPVNNSKRIYTEEEDRFLLLEVNRIGLSADNLYEKIRDRIRKSPLFKFDWFFLSRTPVELSRRVATLLLAVTREVEGPNALKKKSGPKRQAPLDDLISSEVPSTVGSPAVTDDDIMDISSDGTPMPSAKRIKT